jgi:hypothetical protein
MARVLVMAEHVVSNSARTDYFNAIAARRVKAAAAGANFWVFEHSGTAGTFLEFLEAGSTDVLMAAIAEVRATGADFPHMAPVWREVTGV